MRARASRRARPSRGSSPRPRRGCAAPRLRARRLISSTDAPACTRPRKGALHALDRPEQVDRGRPRRRHQVAQSAGTRWRTAWCRWRLLRFMPEREAHGRGDADRRRAANHHRLDGLGHVLGGLAGDVDLRRRQLALVDHHDGVVFPLDGRQHRSSYGPQVRRAYVRSAQALGQAYFNEPRVERQRQQVAQPVAPLLGAQVREDHLEVAAELPQDLAARAARRRRVGGVGHHGDAPEAAVALGERLEHRHALGADGQAVGGVLDVAAGDDGAVGGLERGADLEVRVVGVRVPPRPPRRRRPSGSEPANDALQQRDERAAHAPRRLHHLVVDERLSAARRRPCW